MAHTHFQPGLPSNPLAVCLAVLHFLGLEEQLHFSLGAVHVRAVVCKTVRGGGGLVTVTHTHTHTYTHLVRKAAVTQSTNAIKWQKVANPKPLT